MDEKIKKEVNLKFDRLKSISFQSGNTSYIVSHEKKEGTEEGEGVFIVLKKWSVDRDGIPYKKPTQFWIRLSDWKILDAKVKTLELPN